MADVEEIETTKKQSMCSGCNISYSYSKDLSDEQIVNFLLAHGVITNSTNCPECGAGIRINNNSLIFRCSNRYAKYKKKRKQCGFRRVIWSHTFFHNSRVSPFSVFRLVSAVLWLLPPRNKVINREIIDDTGCKSLINFYMSMNEVFIDAVSENSKKLGGEGLQVELAAAKMKSDNLKEAWDWSLGGIDRQSGETFLAPVENYNYESLKMIISEKINPGSIIITNCTNSLTEVEVEDIKHSLNVTFIHPAYCETSKIIKHHWSEVCKGFTSLSSKRPPHSIEKLAEYLFKSKHPVLTERIHAFFIAAADLWPPGIYSTLFLPFAKKKSTQDTSTSLMADM